MTTLTVEDGVARAFEEFRHSAEQAQVGSLAISRGTMA